MVVFGNLATYNESKTCGRDFRDDEVGAMPLKPTFIVNVIFSLVWLERLLYV